MAIGIHDSSGVSTQQISTINASKAGDNLGKIGEKNVQLNGQVGTIHSDSDSLIDQTKDKTEIVLEEQKERRGSDAYAYEDDESYEEKMKLLESCANRLDPAKGKEQYEEFSKKLTKKQDKAMLFFYKNADLTKLGAEQVTVLYDGKTLDELILATADECFVEVTEKDNALQYALELNIIKEKALEKQSKKTEKNISNLSSSQSEAAKSNVNVERNKLQELKKIKSFNGTFKESIKKAKKKLNDAHKKEIQDGYNLIKKSSDLFQTAVKVNGQELMPTDIATSYRDEVLQLELPVEIFEKFLLKSGQKDFGKYVNVMIELLGRDIDSADPSRSVPFLVTVRDALFKVEVCGQVHTKICNLFNKTARLFENYTQKMS